MAYLGLFERFPQISAGKQLGTMAIAKTPMMMYTTGD
jgi:hypothetical protein